MFGKFGVPAHRIRTILPFVVQPPDRSLAVPERLAAFLATHGPVLLTVGLLEPEYDLFLQIDVLGQVRERYPEAGLIIAGSGSLEEKLRAHIAAQPWRDHVLLYGDMAIARLGSDGGDRTLAALETAYKDRSPRLLFLAVDPRFDRLRSDARFLGLIKRVGTIKQNR